MRYLTLILAVFVLSVTARHTSADDATKRSAELQVLDRFIGTWDSVVTNQTMDDESKTIEERRWSRRSSAQSVTTHAFA